MGAPSSGADQKARTLTTAVRDFPPGYFALVMGTGIISLGLHLAGHDPFSYALLGIATLAYVVLLVLTLVRLVRFPGRVYSDLADPGTGFAFFTFVAATNVLGSRLAAEDLVVLPAVLLAVSFLAWLVLGYLIPGVILARHSGKDILSGINGTWFIWSVASHSVAVLAASLEPHLAGIAQGLLALIAVLSWGVGLALYGVIGCAVVIRVLTRGIPPKELRAPYWVTMGAAAIGVLAGSRIIEMTDTPVVGVMRAPAGAGSVVLWSFATWLIPALVGLGWWRHIQHRVPLRYGSAQWSMVFPVGMYAVAGIYLGQADDLPIVHAIGTAGLWVAFVVWAIVFVAMLLRIGRGLGFGFGRGRAARLGRGRD